MQFKLDYRAVRSKYEHNLDLASAKRRTAKLHDTADFLAYVYWGDAALWPVLALVNNLESNEIPVGRQLVIPSFAQAYAEYGRIYIDYRTA